MRWTVAKGVQHSRVPEAELATMHARGYMHAVEAARRLRMQPNVIYQWIKRGHVTGEIVCGRRQYLLVSSLATRVGPIMASAAGLLPPEAAGTGTR
jgi:hypothetical protein